MRKLLLLIVLFAGAVNAQEFDFGCITITEECNIQAARVTPLSANIGYGFAAENNDATILLELLDNNNEVTIEWGGNSYTATFHEEYIAIKRFTVSKEFYDAVQNWFSNNGGGNFFNIMAGDIGCVVETLPIQGIAQSYPATPGETDFYFPLFTEKHFLLGKNLKLRHNGTNYGILRNFKYGNYWVVVVAEGLGHIQAGDYQLVEE